MSTAIRRDGLCSASQVNSAGGYDGRKRAYSPAPWENRSFQAIPRILSHDAGGVAARVTESLTAGAGGNAMARREGQTGRVPAACRVMGLASTSMARPSV